jgi:hypothetical protein
VTAQATTAAPKRSAVVQLRDARDFTLMGAYPSWVTWPPF